MKVLILMFGVLLLVSCAMPKPTTGDTSIVCVFAKCDVGTKKGDINTLNEPEATK
jgi:hypothetical protein